MTDESQTKNSFIPDIYVDRVRTTLSTFGAALSFGISEPHPENREESKIDELVTVRMSLQHLKIMLILMKKQLKEFEKANEFEVTLPKSVMDKLGLEEEQW